MSQCEIGCSQVLKVLRAMEWNELRSRGVFHGSPDDVRDGFIHLSTHEQVRGTVTRHFAREHGLVLLAIDAGLLGEALRYEVSRGGEAFPHLYGSLSLTQVRRSVVLEGLNGDLDTDLDVALETALDTALAELGRG